ncbi:MAG: EAL domain-containing protein [Candidatus Thiodiazotropha sp. (ex Codakia rugifera)]|nr:EAL domain-containing protein [Candidatus Thiodiazotropha sp. (ex Codakia rugifera)]
MSIKVYLAILILTCLAGGYALEEALSIQFDNVHELSNKYNADLLWEKDLVRTGDNTAQFLISVDLILGSGNTYLIDGTYKKGVLLQKAFAKLSENASLLQNPHLLGASAEQVRSINKLLIQANDLSEGELFEEELSELLIQHDQLGYILASNIQNVTSEVGERLKHNNQILLDKKEDAALIRHIARALFALLIAAVWYWASKQISIPLRHLKESSASAVSGSSFEKTSYGPKEIIDLSYHLESITATLFHQASHDQLTGLYNRRAFERILKQQLEKGSNHIERDALCFIDLDYFKTVNDACGHAEGDKLLISVANILTENIRTSDVVARIGGDEFAIIYMGCTLEKALIISDNIRLAISNIKHHCENKQYQIGASIGVTEIEKSNQTITEILNTADIACSIAKESGRNKVYAYDQSSEISVRNSKKMLSVEQIKAAITHSAFVLYKQDIIPLNSQDISLSRMEILIRMKQADGTILDPEYFLPVAERYRLSNQIDHWVINRTIDWFNDHPHELNHTTSIFINLTAQSLADNELKMFIINKLKMSDFPADKIYFEIKEAAAISNIDDAKLFMQDLRLHGCKFALDDFGSGHSSYAYLKQLPTDIIKIDGVLVKEMTSNSVDYATVKSICEISKAVNQLTVAESVETDEIAASLKKLDVDFAQGFCLSMPEPLDCFHVDNNCTV